MSPKTSSLLDSLVFVQCVFEAAQCCHLAAPLVAAASESHRAEAGSRTASPGISPGGEEADASPALPRAASGAGRSVNDGVKLNADVAHFYGSVATVFTCR